MSKISIKTKIIIGLLILTSVFYVSCEMESYTPKRDTVIADFSENSGKFMNAATESLALGKDVFISHSDYYETKKEVIGFYVSDIREENVEAYNGKNFIELYNLGIINSVSTKVTSLLSAVEFNCGGGSNYYCGVYYVTEDKPLFLPDFSVELSVDGEGFSVVSNNIEWYTQKLSDNFYYFKAQIN